MGKARQLPKKHEETKKQRYGRKKQKKTNEKNNEKNNASIVGKKKYLKENRQPAYGDIQKKQCVYHGHEKCLCEKRHNVMKKCHNVSKKCHAMTLF